jgi:signal transduction histidine kinase
MDGITDQDSVASYQLLVNVAEQLKLPFLQILNQAELSTLSGKADLSSIETSAGYALKLLDNYLLGLRLNHEQLKLDQEPISISAVLYDTSQLLDKLAKQYGVELELSIAGRYEPVIANRHGLQSALVSLGSSLIEAQGAEQNSKLRLQLATHRCRYGVVAGIYSSNADLTTALLRQGRQLYWQARQPMANLTYNAGAGIFVADSIFKAMSLNLQASRHHRLYGLGAVMRSSQQLQLV